MSTGLPSWADLASLRRIAGHHRAAPGVRADARRLSMTRRNASSAHAPLVRPAVALLVAVAVLAVVGCSRADDRRPSTISASGSNGSVRVTLTLEGPPRNDALSWASVIIANL